MYKAKSHLETNQGVFKKGDEVPASVFTKYSRYCEEVKGSNKKVEETSVKEELLVETPVEVIVEVEETPVEVAEEKKPKKKKKGFFNK